MQQSNMPQQRYDSPSTTLPPQVSAELQQQQQSIEQSENINNIMAITSTASTNNSDYNLLYRHPEPLASSHALGQAQQVIHDFIDPKA